MELLIHTFVTLLIVIDPPGIASIFMVLVNSEEAAYQRKLAVKGTAIASLLLLTFFLAGEALLKVLGIGIPSFRIAGGILLFLLAIDMVFARQTGLRSTTARERQEAEHKHDISVFPLAFPLIAGPGALTTVLLMSTDHKSTAIFLAMLVIIFLVLAVTLLSLLFATKIGTLLGETGSNVVSRVLGLILAALAVQYITDGIRATFPNL